MRGYGSSARTRTCLAEVPACDRRRYECSSSLCARYPRFVVLLTSVRWLFADLRPSKIADCFCRHVCVCLELAFLSCVARFNNWNTTDTVKSLPWIGIATSENVVCFGGVICYHEISSTPSVRGLCECDCESRGLEDISLFDPVIRSPRRRLCVMRPRLQREDCV